MNPDDVRELLRRKSPPGRLEAHLAYWGEHPPEAVQQELELASYHAERKSWQKVLSCLAHLDRWQIANEAALAQAPTNAARAKGQAAAREATRERSQTREAEARAHWVQLAHLDEAERVGVIHRKMGGAVTERTIRRYVRPLRKK